MRFIETPLAGAYILELEPREDDRGFFARAFCTEELAAADQAFSVAQANISFNRFAGTVRGLHYQRPPAAEAKLFRCVHGATFHVALDLRPDSQTYGHHAGVELSAERRNAFLIPELCAAGYQSLTDGAEVLYLASAPYTPELEEGIRYDDPAFAVAWPLGVTAVSESDASRALLRTESRNGDVR